MWGIDFFWISAIGLVIITALYTILGGMRSVLYTSVLQTPVLLIGSVVILIIGLQKVGGWGELMAICSAVPVNESNDVMTSLVRSAHDPDFPWTGVLLGSAIIGFWYWCTDQYIVQRVLSGRNMTQARRGAIFGAYLKLTPVFLFLIPGMIAFALNQKGLIVLESSDAAFPTLVREILPIGFKGVVVGGLLAALMSSLASLFNSSAMLFTVDFYKRYRPQSSEKHLVVVGRIATAVIVVLGILWIPIMRGLGQVLYHYLQNVQALLAPGIAAVFLLGVMSKHTTTQGGLWGLFIGFALGMLRLVLDIFKDGMDPSTMLYTWIVAPNILHYEIVIFFITIAVILLVSLVTEKPDMEKIRGLTFRSASPEEKAELRSSWNTWDLVHTVVIVGFIVGFYIYFW
jgi:SSS family solute:Na+ symporter